MTEELKKVVKKIDRRGQYKWFKSRGGSGSGMILPGSAQEMEESTAAIAYKLPEKYPPISEYDDDAAQLEEQPRT